MPLQRRCRHRQSLRTAYAAAQAHGQGLWPVAIYSQPYVALSVFLMVFTPVIHAHLHGLGYYSFSNPEGMKG